MRIGIFEGGGCPLTSGMLGTTVISAKMTEMMKLFGCKEEGGELVGSRNKLLEGSAHWRHLANIVDLCLWQ